MPRKILVQVPAEKLLLIADLRKQVAEVEAKRPSRWYCDRSACDGNPHGEHWHWCEHPAGPDPEPEVEGAKPAWEHRTTCRHARANQCPPDGDWLVWLIQAGRGFGKTRGGAEWVVDRARSGESRRIALVGRSAGDIREVMIEGVSGIMACSPPGFRPLYEPSKRRLTWPNGAIANTFSADEPANLRGPNNDTAWCDELSSWSDAAKGDKLTTAWNNLVMNMRVKGALRPRIVVTTTPKPNKLTREVAANAYTVVTKGSTYDNLANLADSFRHQVVAAYKGTRIGRQELEGELLDDVEGALWTLAQFDDTRGVLVED